MKCSIVLIVFLVLFNSFAWGGIWSPAPATVLASQADVVTLAVIQNITIDPTGDLWVQLQLDGVIKGGPLSASLRAHLAASPMTPKGTHPAAEGNRGLWFLKQAKSGVYDVLPLANGDYSWADAFIPVGLGVAPSSGSTLNQQVLSLMASAYQSLKDPSTIDDERVLVGLDNANGQDGLVVANVLLASPVLRVHLLGLTAAIRLGSDDALLHLAEEVRTLQSQKAFPRITEAIKLYYKPHGLSSIVPLQRLIELHSDAADLDAAAGAALQKIGTKDVLPVMAELLDSPDSQAQIRAASFFGYFTLFADAEGNIPGTGVLGPFASNDTRHYTPRRGSVETSADYAAYWKGWWSSNRARLGFQLP